MAETITAKVAYETNAYFEGPQSGIVEIEFEWPFAENIPFEEANNTQIRVAIREVLYGEIENSNPFAAIVILDGNAFDKMKKNFDERPGAA